MYTIRNIEIRGFRGQQSDIRLTLNPQANFIIGRNGTGKTTLINLIHAVISYDLDRLKDIPFRSVMVKLKKKGTTRKPIIIVNKDADSPSQTITYSIKRHGADPTQDYIVFTREQRKLRVASSNKIITRYIEALPQETVKRQPLQTVLRDLYNITWLSLHRNEGSIPREEDNEWHESDDNRSDVDKRLEHAFENLTGYFYKLDGLVASQLQEFQKSWFLSFLTSRTEPKFADFNKVEEQSDKELLSSIYEKFGLDAVDYVNQLDEQFAEFARVYTAHKKGQPIPGDDIFVLLDTLRLHHLAKQWQNLEAKRIEILKPKAEFEKICSTMLYKKSVHVGLNNIVRVLNSEGSIINLRNLSSGEKQLLIFISETLLQERVDHIFLADEPELSLHVQWQEELVPSLFEINPNAQVIFATHSPDIVGSFQDNVIRMEDLIDGV